MKDNSFDIIVIGGGATGGGVALDAALRGFSVALFEQNDFAEGSSSRSTKLVHGGVRYLEAAVKHLDKKSFDLVREGLHERAIFLKNAPHLAQRVKLVTPLYRWLEIPYIYAGLLLYDLLSGKESLGRSRLLSPKEALKENPSINPKALKGAVSYYDGAFNDSRMVIALLQSAEELGAKLHNYHKVENLIKESGKVCGVAVKDRLGGKEWEFRAKLVINATGPFTDKIRRLDDANAEPLIVTSVGTHIVLEHRFLPAPNGLMIPKTSDGRVLFALPWQGRCLVGTTDLPADTTEHPRPSEEEIDYLIEHANRYFGMKIARSDLLTAFAGLRPLVRKEGVTSTARLLREFATELSESGLLTITGGKWTSYRAMAEHTVNMAAKILNEERAECRTHDYKVVGSRGERSRIVKSLIDSGIEERSARYLYSRYGDRSTKIAQIAKKEGLHRCIHPGFPAIEAEIPYTVEYEYVKRPLDYLARRCNMAMEDRDMALKSLPRVVELMAMKLKWDRKRREDEESLARDYLKEGF